MYVCLWNRETCCRVSPSTSVLHVSREIVLLYTHHSLYTSDVSVERKVETSSRRLKFLEVLVYEDPETSRESKDIDRERERRRDRSRKKKGGRIMRRRRRERERT